jgi:CRP-like cAMP-binding protein
MNDEFNRPELPSIGILSLMQDEDRALLSNYGEFIPGHPGTTVIVQGEPQDSLYFLISGLLHVTGGVDGRVLFISRVQAGETIGEVNIFDPGVASANVVTKDFSQIWRASRADIDAFVNSYPVAGNALLTGVMVCMCRRIRQMNEKLAVNATVSEAARLLH